MYSAQQVLERARDGGAGLQRERGGVLLVGIVDGGDAHPRIIREDAGMDVGDVPGAGEADADWAAHDDASGAVTAEMS